MKNDRKAPYPLKQTAFALLPLAAAIGLTGCGGGTESFNSTTPTPPPQYQSETTEVMSGLVAYYDFEGSLTDAAEVSLQAVAVGTTTEETDYGSMLYDITGGIHAMSTTGVFGGVSGLLLPGDLLSGDSYSVSMWVKPESGNEGPLFFAKSEKGAIVLDHSGLTVSGLTGQGKYGESTVTYTSNDYTIPSNVWSHVALTVEEGLPNVYVNGERAYKGGTLTELRTELADELVPEAEPFIMEADNFNDLFSGTYNSIAIGVTDSDDTAPFAGKIDNLRIFDYALYYGNVTVLSREPINEGPAADITSTFSGADITVSWILDRFPADSISISREAFEGATTELTIPALAGSETSYTDAAVPTGENYRYSLTTMDTTGHIFTSEASDYVRVPGNAPYAGVSAMLNEESEDIELNLYTENLAVGSYDVLRSIDNIIDNAEVIATGITESSYIDVKDDDSKLAAGTSYYYWVSATDANTLAVTNSLSLPAASATAAGEFIPQGVFVLQEETDGQCYADGAAFPAAPGSLDGFENTNQGFTGLGYINTDNYVGAGMYWRVNVETSGSYDLTIHYTNSDNEGEDRSGILNVNGEEAVNPVSLVVTDESGLWQVYGDVKHAITLEAGDNTLSLKALTSKGLANVDYLRFEARDPDGATPVGVPCRQ
ncbi:LamG-like jellyroll fold domain-containing protein [Teredinibacter franksiae]|uniref:LamG-like jellyroll fold domain-containing protein n=1 Tax=Teredinibacter franksiae TaxID=2761453 RepID=UPI00162AE54C|nr:LamG-like jellyroll fold domain-containing protein [Teredinibacter franksiae]